MSSAAQYQNAALNALEEGNPSLAAQWALVAELCELRYAIEIRSACESDEDEEYDPDAPADSTTLFMLQAWKKDLQKAKQQKEDWLEKAERVRATWEAIGMGHKECPKHLVRYVNAVRREYLTPNDVMNLTDVGGLRNVGPKTLKELQAAIRVRLPQTQQTS